ncbi:hypothetical protein ACN27E_10505 [Mycobacterium sp. WMMD1722]|uniref:hypothetical protein n=1 Tax=Mycobacterium sp. WMMD1722 TaxID=3404117 RepID=UPI003BF55184
MKRTASLTLLAVAAVAAIATTPAASAQPIQISSPTSPDANPAAVTACAQFAEVLDAAATYYGDFADALDENAGATTGNAAVADSNVVGRTALRQGAAAALTAANTPGLPPDIAHPMRMWSVDATKLLLKMGLRGTGDTLDVTATELNADAVAAQQGCAAAGTHA